MARLATHKWKEYASVAVVRWYLLCFCECLYWPFVLNNVLCDDALSGEDSKGSWGFGPVIGITYPLVQSMCCIE